MVTKANPNVVPLCDILLVLLIIFMVISPMAQAGVDVRLPEPGPGGRAIVLTIEKEGLITVNNEEYNDLEILGKRLTDIYGAMHEKTIFVQAHQDVLYKYVVKTLDVIKGAGVDNVCMMPSNNL